MKTETTPPPEHSAPNNTPALLMPTNYDVPVDQIVPDPNNRDTIDNERVASLAASIRAEGLLQPVLLLQLGIGKYRLIAGEHRWRAHLKLNLGTIAARVYKHETDLSAARKKAVENFQRTQLTPIEEARKYRELQDLGMKQGEVGELLGKSQPVVSNALRLLELPGKVQAMLGEGLLTAAHGVSLCRFAKWPAPVVIAMAEFAVEDEMSSKDLSRQEIPFNWKLKDKGLIAVIDTSKRSWHATHSIPEHLQKDPDFLKVRGDEWVCFAPPKWAPIAKEQEAAFQKTQSRSGGKLEAGQKMSPKQKADRAKLIKKNAANRQAVDAGLRNAVARLAQTNDIDELALTVICERAGGQLELTDAAKALGIKLAKDPRTLADYKALGLPLIVKLVATTIMLEEADEAKSSAWDVPDSVSFIAGKFKAPVERPGGNEDPATEPPKVVKKAGKARRSVISDETRFRVKKLVEAGKTGSQIAKAVGISLPSVQNIKLAFGLVKKRT